MRRSSLVAAIALGVAGAATNAEARLDLYVDKSAQLLSVIQDGALLYVWPVSTGIGRHSTPSGVFAPERLERSWFSRAYYNSPMPFAIFFHNGYAIHGSYDIARLGGPASHGCVRLHPRNAAILFSMVEQEGPGNTAIFVGSDSGRLPPRDRDFDVPPEPPLRRDDDGARDDWPAPPLPPPPPRRPSPYFPGGAGALPYYPPEPYSDSRAPRGPAPGPYGAPADYAGGRDGPRAPRDPGPYAGGGGLPPGPPRDPYDDGRSNPYSYRPAPPSFYPPDRRADARGAAPRHQRDETAPPPYDMADRHADGPMRRNGDLPATRGAGPANRPPALRTDEAAQRTPRSGVRPVTAAARPGPLPPAGDAPGRRAIAGPAAKAFAGPPPAPVAAAPAPFPPPPVAPPPAPAARAAPPQEHAPEAAPPGLAGYRVLPPSYWAGASWRWRTPRDAAPQPQ
jgi:hypothetical protein